MILYHITSHHIISHHTTPHRTTQHHTIGHHATSQHTTPHHITTRGAKQGGWSQPPLNFGWGVEHLSNPPDFEIYFREGWIPLN